MEKNEPCKIHVRKGRYSNRSLPKYEKLQFGLLLKNGKIIPLEPVIEASKQPIEYTVTLKWS